ncbi:hypothetical protein MSAN_01353100 [Mycena sanguinolenta]|uniref:Uncharacterized protein n=1 Tax=Mycena sanguinolenta TaxID=230812 RepID=A0A8H7D320_9AGAR|nr:hypothetical protein MSAN_01353100 [Mycena sanguinolenta]
MIFVQATRCRPRRARVGFLAYPFPAKGSLSRFSIHLDLIISDCLVQAFQVDSRAHNSSSAQDPACQSLARNYCHQRNVSSFESLARIHCREPSTRTWKPCCMVAHIRRRHAIMGPVRAFFAEPMPSATTFILRPVAWPSPSPTASVCADNHSAAAPSVAPSHRSRRLSLNSLCDKSDMPPPHYPDPPTGHDLMALFPPAAPNDFHETYDASTSVYFWRQERAFFAQAGNEIARVRVDADPEKAPRGPGPAEAMAADDAAMSAAATATPSSYTQPRPVAVRSNDTGLPASPGAPLPRAPEESPPHDRAAGIFALAPRQARSTTAALAAHWPRPRAQWK